MVAIRLAGCYYAPVFSKNREEVTMETINGEILVDWNTFVDQECAVGHTTKFVIVTDENVGDESSLTVCGLVEATIYGRVEVEGNLFRRVRIHLTGGVRLDVVNTDDPESPNRFPCTLTYE